MPFDFPNSPTEGQIFAPPGGLRYKYQAQVWDVIGSAAGQELAQADTYWPSRATLVASIAGDMPVYDGKLYTAGGYDYIGTVGATAIPDLPGLMPDGDWYPQHFGAKWDDVTDDLAAHGVPLNLTPGTARLSGVFRRRGMPMGSKINVRGPGRESCFFKPMPGATESFMMDIGNTRTTGPLSTQFPSNSSGWSLSTSSPVTTVATTVNAGSWDLPVADASLIPVGALIEIKQQRINYRAETRNANTCGELNKVKSKSGNTLLLEMQTADAYPAAPATIWSGTIIAAAVDGRTVTIDTGLPSVIKGSRILITTGGVTQQRYITFYDAATGVADVVDSDSSSTYYQKPLSPLPVAGSTAVVDQITYIYVIEPVSTRMSGFSVFADPADTKKFSQCLQVAGGDAPFLDDVGTGYATGGGLWVDRCFRPRVNGYNGYSHAGSAAGGDSGGGNGIGFGACRDGVITNMRTYGNRSGTDSGSYIPSWGMRFAGGVVIGTKLDEDGVPWSEDNSNRAIGCHGQAADWTFEDFHVSGTKWVSATRGKNIIIRNLTSVGPFNAHFYVLRGEDFTVDGYNYDGHNDARQVSNYPGSTDHDIAGHMFFVFNGVEGLVSASNIVARDLSGDVFFAWPNGDPDPLKRMPCRFVNRNVNVGWNSPNTRYLVSGAATFAAKDWDLETPRFTIRGGGSYGGIADMSAWAATIGIGHYNRLDGRWMVTIKNDDVVTIPVAESWGNSDRIIVKATTSDARPIAQVVNIDASLRVNSTEMVPFSTSGSKTIVAAAAAPVPGLTPEAANTVTLHFSGTALTIKNRAGLQLNMWVDVIG
jgi:hypothetical protein